MKEPMRNGDCSISSTPLSWETFPSWAKSASGNEASVHIARKARTRSTSALSSKYSSQTTALQKFSPLPLYPKWQFRNHSHCCPAILLNVPNHPCCVTPTSKCKFGVLDNLPRLRDEGHPVRTEEVHLPLPHPVAGPGQK